MISLSRLQGWIIMNNMLVLFSGELQRMKKYNVLGASLLVAIIWVGVLAFTEVKDVTRIFPLLLYIDATSMAMLMIGVTMFFEKQEGTIKTLLVSPIRKWEYIVAKTLANVLSNVFTLVVLYLYAIFFKEIDVNILGLFIAIVMVSFFHSLIGFILTYYSKDFTDLLMGMMKYAFILMIPVLLAEVGVIKNEIFKKALYAIPTKASLVLLQAPAGGMKGWEIALSTSYIIVASLLLYLLVSKKFDEFAIKESGV